MVGGRLVVDHQPVCSNIALAEHEQDLSGCYTVNIEVLMYHKILHWYLMQKLIPAVTVSYIWTLKESFTTQVQL